MEAKRCSRCKEDKARAEFARCAKLPSGLQPHCRECQRAYNKAFYAANRDEERARALAHRKANPEKVASTSAAWRAANKERHAAMKRAYREKNPERVKAARKASYEANRARENAASREYKARNKAALAARASEYLRANPEYNRFARSLRRAAEKRAMPAWADLKKMRSVYAAATERSASGVPHHVDHIVPLQSKLVCGLHWEGNLQVIPGVENQSKSNSCWPDMPAEIRS